MTDPAHKASSAAEAPEISVVVPVLNEERNIPELIDRLSTALETLQRPFELIFVDDGSADNTFELLKSYREKRKNIRLLRLTRRFGQHPALSAGYEIVKGKYVVTIDADLQTPPEEIPRLFARLEADPGLDIVFGRRKNRNDPAIRKISSYFINLLAYWLTDVRRLDIGCMLFVARREVIDRLNGFEERSKIIPTLFNWMGARQIEVDIAHVNRKRGASRYRLFRLMRQTLDLITAYTTLPIQTLWLVGLFLLVFGVVLGFWGLVAAGSLTGLQPAVIAIVSVGSIGIAVNVLILSLLGEYIARIFMDLQKRPYFIVRDRLD